MPSLLSLHLKIFNLKRVKMKIYGEDPNLFDHDCDEVLRELEIHDGSSI